jgi:DNA-binding FadR family transcriptional regulator
MRINQTQNEKQIKFFDYLALKIKEKNTQVPPISDLSVKLGISASSLREQLVVARELGFLDIQPRLGIRIQPYSFTPAVVKSAAFAIECNQELFKEFSSLREHLESSFFIESIKALTNNDIEELKQLVITANEKLSGKTIQIPHQEHKKLHLSMYKRLNNIFVIGCLEAYWEIYENVGLDIYTDLNYLNEVWQYHHEIVEMIAKRDYLKSHDLLIKHMNLLYQRE